MTEQTTTEILSDALEEVDDCDKASNVQRKGNHAFWASQAFMRLHNALTSGSPLPTQWPQAAEIEQLRTELAALRKALDDRRTVEGWAKAPDEERFYIVSSHIGNGKFTVTLTDMALMDPTDYEEGAIGPIHEYEFEFPGDTPDEAFSAAAERVRHQ